MTKFISIAAPADLPATAKSHPLVSIALFSAIGLLLSLAVLIADRQLPGDWF